MLTSPRRRPRPVCLCVASSAELSSLIGWVKPLWAEPKDLSADPEQADLTKSKKTEWQDENLFKATLITQNVAQKEAKGGGACFRDHSDVSQLAHSASYLVAARWI